MTEEARRELYEITDSIAELERKLHTIRREKRELTDRANAIRARLVMEIGTAKDHRQRRLYSTRDLRQAVLTVRLDENDEYQALKRRLWEMDDAERTLAIEHQRLADRRTLRMLEMGWGNLPSSGSK
ncbi:MAG TPA: hypothetical protein VMX14_12105 [Anaerolineae bacterium]|nr:hypothetical protein [Anaerolineae bacterium]